MLVGIHYGIMYPDIATQIRTSGCTIKSLINVQRHEKFRTAINSLRMSEIITDREAEKAFKRLHKKVVNNVEVIE